MSSFVFYGPPGSGKSTLAASACTLGYRVHFIDADRKLKSMANLKEWIDEGKVTYDEISVRLSEISLEDRIRAGKKYFPKRPPQGYFKVAEILDDLIDNPPEDASRTILVLDSATRVNEHLKRLLKHFGQTPKMTFDEWDAFLSNWEELCDNFFHLQPDPYAHCILIAHVKTDTNEDGGIIGLSPHIDGQFREKLGSYVEEMYYCEVEAFSKHQPAKFKITTKPVGLIKHARTSRVLPTYTDQDIAKILGREGS